MMAGWLDGASVVGWVWWQLNFRFSMVHLTDQRESVSSSLSLTDVPIHLEMVDEIYVGKYEYGTLFNALRKNPFIPFLIDI